MSVKRIAGLYKELSIWERIPLLVAADGRQDETEHTHLLTTSPRKVWHFAEHHLAEIHLHILALIYVTEQLDAIGMYLLATKEISHESNAEWELLALTSAYNVAVQAKGWRLFCSELGIDGVVLARLNYFGSLLSLSEEQLIQIAPTSEELLPFIQRAGVDATSLVTADRIQASWRDLLNRLSTEGANHDH